MRLNISREQLLQAINLVFKAADKRHNMPILANLKLEASPEQLVIIGSDLEVELQAQMGLAAGVCQEAGSTTVPANKFKDIIKLLPEGSMVRLSTTKDKQCSIESDNSRFRLSTLAAEDFPRIGEPEQVVPIRLQQSALSQLLDSTYFAMAVQDVRYYLTGMLFELNERQLTTVATDGHRLAVASTVVEASGDQEQLSAIVPRKAILELQRLLLELKKIPNQQERLITLHMGREMLQVTLPFGEANSPDEPQPTVIVTFTARLIEGKFPDYRRVMPAASDKTAIMSHTQLAEVLRRVAVLSNEKLRGVIFNFQGDNQLEIRANNAEYDEARSSLMVQYAGEPLEISFNVAYLLDVLNVVEGDIKFSMSQANSSVLLNQVNVANRDYVVMPIRI